MTDDTYEASLTMAPTIILQITHMVVTNPVWNVTTYHESLSTIW